jgi:uncharacterized membrane protein YjgN (DUF898 family)
VFRGVRFSMTGSAWVYAGRAVAWDILTILSLGLAYPWRAAALERYRMRHTRFGDLSGGFDGRGATLFKRGFLLWLLAVGWPLLAGLVAARRAWGPIAAGDADAIGEAVGVGPAAALIAWLVAAPLLYPLFHAIRLRWLLDGLRFGAVEGGSDLRKGTVYGLYALTVLALTGFGLVAAAALGVIGSMAPVSLASLGEGSWAVTPLVVLGLMALAYLGLLIGFGIIHRYFLGRGLWAAAVASVTIANLSAADTVSAAGAPASAVGEGLADALDVGVF